MGTMATTFLSVRSLAQAVRLVGLLLVISSTQAAAKSGQLVNDLRGPMSESAAPRSQEPKEQHASRHADVDRTLARDEANCYQLFAVNGCLLEARARARAERAEIDERERLEKAADRQARSEALQRERASRQTGPTGATGLTGPAEGNVNPPSENASGPSHAKPPRPPRPLHEGSKAKLPLPKAAPSLPHSDIQTPRQDRVAGETQHDPREQRVSAQTQREHRASAQTQRPRAQTQRDERAASQIQRDMRARRARAQLLEKRAAAHRRQASIEQRRQLREAKGHVLPLPLAPVGIQEAL